MIFKSLPENPKAVRLSRLDVNNPLAAYSKHSFDLDGAHWPSVEHYYQARLFQSNRYKEQIRAAAHPQQATKLGKTWFQRKHADWKSKRLIWMTRAVYTKCHTHPEVADLLLSSGSEEIIDTTQFDYFWGVGRDGRGENGYGQVLMAVRQRLQKERQQG